MIAETRIYKRTEKLGIHADIYYHGSGTPVILYIHGGALIFGSRKWLSKEQVQFYKEAGFSVVSIDYRLAPESKLNIILTDIEDAIDWVRNTLSQVYDINSDKLVLVGCSAGAYLSLISGTMKYRPKAIVSFYGYGDILGDWYAKPNEHYCNRGLIKLDEAEKHLTHEEVTEGVWERFNYYIWCRQNGSWVDKVTEFKSGEGSKHLSRYNPIDNVNREFPPTIFLHGDKDTDVPYEQSVLMHKALLAEGVETELITIYGADHVFDQNMNDVQVKQAFINLEKFLKKHINNV